jgi:hypothetical protein
MGDTQQRGAGIMRSLARAVAVGGSAVVLVIPMLIGLSSQPAPRATALSPTASPTPAEVSRPVPLSGEQLVRPGQTVTIDGVDGSGVWGSIELTRGEDTGGYPEYAIGADVFLIEIVVEYLAERVPNLQESGSVDWTLTSADGDPVGRLIYPAMPSSAADWDPAQQPLGHGYSVLVDVLTVPIKGTLYFEVPRAAADRDLVLLYRPQGFQAAVFGIAVREPSPAPDPVPTATPVPTARTLTYVSREGLPFPIVESPEADALFVAMDTCLNAEDGYRLNFPASWYTNAQIGAVPPCTWFAPVDFMVPALFAVRPEFQPPDGVVIIVMGFEGGYGYLGSPTFSLDDEITIGAFEGWRREEIGGCFEGTGCGVLPPRYEYVVHLGADEVLGPTLLAVTSSEGIPTYELNKAVLDRIMASIEFLP